MSGWLPTVGTLVELSHEAGVPVPVDAAQLAPHRPLPAAADYLAWSGHKMYAPFGAGALVGPRATFAVGDPFLAGGGAVEPVSLDEVLWNAPPEREEAGSPNVVGAVAFAADPPEWRRRRAMDDHRCRSGDQGYLCVAIHRSGSSLPCSRARSTSWPPGCQAA
ncbi:MAG: aminotransferase class V-fold PLP-dependent enzyme [Actinomycetota bacterium]|nr:aminotransferase class V-fold PLP-dependent enzyme [Actinomycetota bacterium]